MPGQAIGEAVIDRRHDRIVKHVGVEMDPEAAKPALREMSHRIPRGDLDTPSPNLGQVE